MKYNIFCRRVIFMVIIVASPLGYAAGIKKRVLVGSPIRQNPYVLKEFLESLDQQRCSDIELDFHFIDDNDDQCSKDLLQEFAGHYQYNCLVETGTDAHRDHYLCNENTHYWNDKLIWRVAGFKDRIIAKALRDDYDYLFFIDSDIVMDPATIQHLKDTGKDIISEIFWTQWQPDAPSLPQVWIQDVYTQTPEFIEALCTPGIYEVGGLGACTLISKEALKSGVNFSQLYNLSFWGEDRHFCVRAVALGYTLYVDTHYPAYHIYRESALCGLMRYKKVHGLAPDRPLITLAMCVKNEAHRYLTEVLTAAKEYIDAAVIVDDASTDDTVALCKNILSGIPTKIIKNSESKFCNEVELRLQLWNETIATDPEWILVLDADEIFENTFKDEIRSYLVPDDRDAIYCRLYDFWNKTQYRDDELWCAHYYYRPFLIRYRQGMTYTWLNQAQHCGRLPANTGHFPYILCPLRLKHYGWAREEDRVTKYKRYQTLDPDGRYGSSAHYESIIDESPHLTAWIE